MSDEDDELRYLQELQELEDMMEPPMAGMAECAKFPKIWRDHKFVNGVCVQCGRKLQ